MTEKDLTYLKKLAGQAGDAIMEIFESEDFDVEMKADDSPLTRADRKAHQVIDQGLKTHYPEIPILSEEGNAFDFQTRKGWEEFWLVDPLDGTKEFIKRGDDFTVNIALIRNRRPVMGVVYQPRLATWYYALYDQGAFKQVGEGLPQQIRVNGKKEGLVAVRSKSHASPEEDEILGQYHIQDSVSVGSSIKFCYVAEGNADIYYRHGPTSEWDIAAGHAVVNAAGGSVTYPDDSPFLYNKPDILNSPFLCRGF